jgi:riboflavin kinase
LPKALILKGEVFSGSGEGAEYIKLPWVREQIRTKLGFDPYPGTLNVRLLGRKKFLKDLLKKVKPEKILPKEGFCCGVCFRAVFRGFVKCGIVLPKIAGYPENVIEIVAPVNLREKFGLKDGEIVRVEIVS